jgi:hypothetical protein
VNRWMLVLQTAYTRLSRAFPLGFRMVCGDGLDRLGQDVVPIVWRDEGAAGLIRLFADVVFRLPMEYVSSWWQAIEEVTMAGDLFEGTWKSNPEHCQWDPTYTPEQACLRFEPTPRATCSWRTGS